MRVLIVEDELKLSRLLRKGLQEDGHAVDLAETGEDALWMAGSTPYDAIVLDVMLPGIDGFETCERLRKDDVWAPILMLTARDAVADRVSGLDGGADDYLTKPFAFPELKARLRSLARRGDDPRPTSLESGGLVLDPADRSVRRDDTAIELSRTEFAMLEAFMQHEGKAMTRLQLLEHVWDDRYENRSNVVDVYVRYLRAKIDEPFGTDSIETIRGVGYRWRRDQ